MGQNTKIAGYNAEATPLAGVNPVHTIQFGICITGRKNADTPETVETKVVKDAESLSVSVDGTIEEWSPMDQKGPSPTSGRFPLSSVPMLQPLVIFA